MRDTPLSALFASPVFTLPWLAKEQPVLRRLPSDTSGREMPPHSVRFSFRQPLLLAPLLALLTALPSLGATVALRAAPGFSASPAAIVAGHDLGDTYCYATHCIVRGTTTAHASALDALAKARLVSVEPLPEADLLFFANATYDLNKGAFDRVFPGQNEAISPSAVGSFVVVFKSYPEQAWLDKLRASGLAVLEPMPTMGYGVYGDREAIQSLPKAFSFVAATLEVPPGIKRFNLDSADGSSVLDTPGPTTFVVPTAAAQSVLSLFASWKTPPAVTSSSGSTTAYTAALSRADARQLSRLPEVLSIRREAAGVLSDERLNRIVGGTYQTPGTSWPSTLGTNSYPYYWNSYISSLNLTLNNQKIGFMDTGIDRGLQENGSAVCPPHLTPDSGPCRLIFTADAYLVNADAFADDHEGHGTLVTSIAAGLAGSASNGRDTHSYAFTQGVAQDAKVAMFRALTCDNVGYRDFPREPNFTGGNMPLLASYGIVEMSATSSLPDASSVPGVTLFNHSWNIGATYDYEAAAQILDQATRDLSAIQFDFGASSADIRYGASGSTVPSLHVVSAGNIDGDSTTTITAPGTAKNVITVGATETYNNETYTAGCGDNNADNADNPHQISGNSRIGFPNLRLKPDLVAPGTRAYGRRSALLASGCGLNYLACNNDLNSTNSYVWNAGTSFAAPAVTGAAAMVREWLTSQSIVTSPSPALIKATLIATATNLVPCPSGCSTCSVTGDMRPAPDKYQGWGGLSLDFLFRPSSNYYFYNQDTTFTSNGSDWTHTINIADASKDVFVALVWTDHANGALVEYPYLNLTNDLDLEVSFTDGQGTHTYYGNVYYDSIDSCARDGFSMKDPTAFSRDHKNNVEKVSIRHSDIPSGVTSLQIKVIAYALTGDGIAVNGSTNRQDFAVMAYNAH